MPQQENQNRGQQSQRPQSSPDITSQPKKQQGDMGSGSELKDTPKSKSSDRTQGSEEAW